MTKNNIVINYTPITFKQKLARTYQSVPISLKRYFQDILPILTWIHRYNLTWLVQDIIAGVTVGIVLVPQSMAYAKIANLPPQYGLYTSFIGSSIYCLFGTSKDISVGPVSTISLLIGSAVHTVTEIYPEIPPVEIAITLTLFSGLVMVIMSLLRLGILIDFIPEPAIAGYMTGSAITIVLGQCPKLFGIKDVSTHDAPYLVLTQFLTKLQNTQLDAAFGLSSLVFLYLVRFICNRFNCNSPFSKRMLFLFGIMRNGLIVIICTFICFMVIRNKEDIGLSIIKSVPAGLDAIGIPRFHIEVVREASSVIPSIILISVLEHVSVGKSFGRINGYQVNPNQEILAVGISNILNPFFGGFSCTGAFSRTAIMARSGSRTPIAGVFSGAIVVLALYVLTPAFYYIPEAVLSAVIIHAVSDLASKAKYLTALWSTSCVEFLVWITAVLVTVFVDIESGIYAAVGLSLIILLYRLARPPIKTISRITISQGQYNHQISSDSDSDQTINMDILESRRQYLFVDEKDPNFIGYRNNLPSGVLILQLCDSILYPNAEYISGAIVNAVKLKTRGGVSLNEDEKDSQRNWNDPRESLESISNKLQLPILQAIIIDFAAVSRVDATAVKALTITKDTLDRYAGHAVEWHFVGLQNLSTRSILVNAGFGSLDSKDQDDLPSLINSTSSDENDDCSLISIVSQNEKLKDTFCSPPMTVIKDVPRDNLRCSSPVESMKLEMPDKAFMFRQHSNFAHNPQSCHCKIETSASKCTPVDVYPCFHWDFDSAIQSFTPV
ncbi:sulfate transporter family-domain-containing protein [Mycotypha africana]|uniref:sulfate transporter family-domain-containing protein n=1 Tax=Mycotypha africana TaxID=64632 RepID=UPI002301FA31|nr:sulfate transporter family-domain-containing protein [Mycotypha africana]KAI8967034.1 sulfate transporter family-domain-containing protein [Mycotypha africana]